MKKFERYITGYWFLIVIGLIATRYAVRCAYIERGYKAFGGEWFVLPIILLVVKLATEIILVLVDALGTEEDACEP